MYDINFFEPYIDTKGSRSDKLKLALIVAGALFGIVFVYALANKIQVQRLNKEITNITNTMSSEEFVKKKASVEEKQAMMQDLKVKEEKVEYIASDLQKKDRLGGHLVEIITNSIPENIFLKQMGIDEGQIKVEGLSRAKEDIAQFESNLREILYFEDVFVPKITYEDGFYNFDVVLKLASSSEEEQDQDDNNKDKEENDNETK